MKWARAIGLAGFIGAACYGQGGTDVGGFALGADVAIVTDDLGVAHVYGKSDADAMYGAGYAMARDRLFQMELTRRQALGTSAEVLGPSALKGDIGARAFGFGKLGEADAQRIAAERPADAALVAAWCAGVNARIDEVQRGAVKRPYGLGAGELDFVPERWVPAHPHAIGKLLGFGLSNSLDAEILATALLRLAPDFAKRLPIALPTYDTFTMGNGPPATGPAPAPLDLHVPKARGALAADASIRFLFDGGHSNNWAIDAAHSQDGRPLLAGDPHQPLSSPIRFWPVHVNSADAGGTLDVEGFVFVGTPLVELGHNARVGWTATTNFADAMDLWDVTTDADRTSVTLGDGVHPIATRTETIKVKGEADEVVTLEEVPGYGILLPEQVLPLPRSLLADGNAILFQWTGFRATRELSGYLAIDRAKSVDEFEAGASLIDVGAVNFVAADAQHIEYFVHAAVPDRGDPSTHAMPWHILSGTDAASLWSRGDLGADKLPRWRDPARGYLVTANNDPWGFTRDGRVDDDPFYYGTFYATGARAHRIEEMITSRIAGGAKLATADLEEMQDDTHSPYADTLLPHLAAAVAAASTDAKLASFRARGDLRQLAAALSAWDRRFQRDRGEPVIFAALQWFAVKRAFGAALPSALFDAIGQKAPPFLLGHLRNVLDGRFLGADTFTGGANGGSDALLLAALDDTATWLNQRFHSLDPSTFRWSDVNFAVFANAYGHALDAPPVAVDGTNDTVKVCEASFLSGGRPLDRLSAHEVSLYRMVMGFDDDGVVRSSVSFARGSREDPTDAHFGDMEARWADGAHVPFAFRRADVEGRATERVTLLAGGGTRAN